MNSTSLYISMLIFFYFFFIFDITCEWLINVGMFSELVFVLNENNVFLETFSYFWYLGVGLIIY